MNYKKIYIYRRDTKKPYAICHGKTDFEIFAACYHIETLEARNKIFNKKISEAINRFNAISTDYFASTERLCKIEWEFM